MNIEQKTENKKTILVSLRDCLSAMAYCIIQQSPYIPAETDDVIKELKVILAPLFDKLDKTKLGYMEFNDKWELDKFFKCYFYYSNKFRMLNLSKYEIDIGITDAEDPLRPIKFTVTSRYSTPQPEYDFIDLDALTRNAAWLICAEAGR
jgi:hypothetical protein